MPPPILNYFRVLSSPLDCHLDEEILCSTYHQSQGAHYQPSGKCKCSSKCHLINCFFGPFLVPNVRLGFLEADSKIDFDVQNIYQVSIPCRHNNEKAIKQRDKQNCDAKFQSNPQGAPETMWSFGVVPQWTKMSSLCSLAMISHGMQMPQLGHTFEQSLSLKLRSSLKDRTVSTEKTLGGTSPSHQKKKYRDKCEVFNLGLNNEHICLYKICPS